jgi:hypothetical protein
MFSNHVGVVMRIGVFSCTSTVVLAALLSSSASANTNIIIVDDLGSINESSVSLPSTKMPGSGDTFTYYFEFSLPMAEYVSASMSISGPVANQIPSNDGSFILSNWTSTGSSAPSGATIEDVTISAPAPGGESAFLGTMTSMGDLEPAGSYYIEIAGTSAGGSLQLAVDGNVTAAAPELSTWALLLLGFAGLGYAGYGKRRTGRLSEAIG